MNEAVDRRSGGHRVLEDPVPLAEDQVAGDDQGPTFVALGHEREEDLRLVGALLHIAEVGEDHDVVGVERSKRTRQAELATGRQQLLNQLVGRDEEHADAGADQRVTDRARDVALTDARAAEQQDVVAALDERAAGEVTCLDQNVTWHAGGVERVERLRRREPRCAPEAIDAAFTACLPFDLEHLGQDAERLIAAGVEEPLRHLLGGARQLELGEELRDPIADLGRVDRHAAPAIVISSS